MNDKQPDKQPDSQSDSQPEPQDPIASPLMQAALAMHEMYLAYQAAGFAKEEAMQFLIAGIIQRPQPPQT